MEIEEEGKTYYACGYGSNYNDFFVHDLEAICLSFDESCFRGL
jgi:hypothetical protein